MLGDSGSSDEDNGVSLTIRIPSGVVSPKPFNPECPVCGNIISGTMNDVQMHVEECLNDGQVEEEVNRVERIEVFDDPSLVNVEGDDSRYGKPQYTYDMLQSIIGQAESMHLSYQEYLHELPPNPSKAQLLERVKLQRTELERVPRCLICLEQYRDPVVSIVCWHVSCEVCWCRTLQAKKMCPQCNQITSPIDLRRIYM